MQLWSHASKLLSLPEGWEGCDRNATKPEPHTLLPLFIELKGEEKSCTAWLSSLLTFWCLSQYSFFFSLSGFFPLQPTFPISSVVTETEDKGSVISCLTPGLGCVTPAAVKRRSSLIRWVLLKGSVVERQPPLRFSQPSHISQRGRDRHSYRSPAAEPKHSHKHLSGKSTDI